MYEEIAKYLRDSRRSTGFSQKELAKRLGYRGQFISNWERGKCLPPVSVLKKLCGLLPVTPDKLVALMLDVEKHRLERSFRDD